MLNHISLQGRLVADPELRYTTSQIPTPVTTFRIAVDRNVKDRNGERQTDFINIVAFGRTGENVAKYFDKGRMILLEGRLQVRNYELDDGRKRTATEVVCERAYFVDSKPTNRTSPEPLQPAPSQVEYEGFETIDDDDIPF